MRTQFSFTPNSINIILAILFFCSGCAALIYQIIWQRMLFGLFGVDIFSVTIIVSVFMFGLGIGGLIGGYLADKNTTRLLTWYLFIEISIAIFGFASPYLIATIGNIFFFDNKLIMGIISFLTLAFPTMLMGATFPLLVIYINQLNRNIGVSVGSLYFANTIGGAVGAYLSGFVLLYSMDTIAVVNRAAILNLAIALTVFLLFRKRQA